MTTQLDNIAGWPAVIWAACSRLRYARIMELDAARVTALTPTVSIVSVVLGGLGVLLSIVPFVGIVAAVAGVLLAHRGRARAPRGLWLASLIVGYLGLALSAFWSVVWIVAG